MVITHKLRPMYLMYEYNGISNPNLIYVCQKNSDYRISSTKFVPRSIKHEIT